MEIKVCLFGALAEQFKKSEVLIPCQNPIPLRELYNTVFAEIPDQGLTWQNVLLFAKNCEHVDFETMVQSGDEVAFMPPMAGG